MNLTELLQSVLLPARETGRGVALDLIVGVVALVMAMAGGGFLTAAGFWLLAAEVGHPAAAAIIGAGLIALAAIIALVRQSQRRERQRRLREIAAAQAAAQAAARDPLPSLVFDLAYLASRQFLSKRR